VPELPGERQYLGRFGLRYRNRGVIRDAVALAPEAVEFADQGRVSPEGVLYRFDSNRVVAGRIGVRTKARGMQGRGRHGEGRVVRELKAPLDAQCADAGVSETSIGQREQAGDFVP